MHGATSSGRVSAYLLPLEALATSPHTCLQLRPSHSIANLTTMPPLQPGAPLSIRPATFASPFAALPRQGSPSLFSSRLRVASRVMCRHSLAGCSFSVSRPRRSSRTPTPALETRYSPSPSRQSEPISRCEKHSVPLRVREFVLASALVPSCRRPCTYLAASVIARLVGRRSPLGVHLRPSTRAAHILSHALCSPVPISTSTQPPDGLPSYPAYPPYSPWP